jgi:hypothetical protein
MAEPQQTVWQSEKMWGDLGLQRCTLQLWAEQQANGDPPVQKHVHHQAGVQRQ